jgi:hypothetical protein
MNKYPEAASVVQVYEVVSDVENFAKCTPANVGESSEWTSVANSAKENRASFYKGLDGKPLFSTPYIMYTLTLNELKVSAQVGQSGVVRKTSVESMAYDADFHEVKTSKIQH